MTSLTYGDARRTRWLHGVLAMLTIALMGMICCATTALGSVDVQKGDATHAGRTMYMYVCGSNLESEQGQASRNIKELLQADIPDDMSVIIQTGGASDWRLEEVPEEHPCRFEVKNHKLVKLEDVSKASMGASQTLSDFLAWGAKRFWGEHNMLVLLGHGGISGDALCFDELWDDDGLSRSELVSALADAELPSKLDLIVFDACFMASMENALALREYGNYMVASQEAVPECGLDYMAMVGDYERDAGQELGVRICDAYMSKCKESGSAYKWELSLLDLSKTEVLCVELDRYFEGLAQLWQTDARESAIVAGCASAGLVYDRAEMTNQYDLRSFLDMGRRAGGNVSEGLDAALDAFVVHFGDGGTARTRGVSLFYPFLYDASMVQRYVASCPIAGYKQLLKQMFRDAPHDPIQFDDRGSLDADGNFRVTLKEGRERYLASATLSLYKCDADGSSKPVYMGESSDVQREDDGFTLKNGSALRWPSMGGVELPFEVRLNLPHVAVYVCPVLVDQSSEMLCAVYEYDGEYSEGRFARCGLWKGEGYALEGFDELENGALVQVLPAKRDTTSVASRRRLSDNGFVVSQSISMPEYMALDDGTYEYQITLRDVFGEEKKSNVATLELRDSRVQILKVRSSK